MVSSLAAAISDVGVDAADHRLDCECYPDVRPVALARTWASMGATSRLGHAAGIRMRGDGCCDYCRAPDHAAGGDSCATGLVESSVLGPNAIFVSGNPGASSNATSVQFTEEGRS